MAPVSCIHFLFCQYTQYFQSCGYLIIRIEALVKFGALKHTNKTGLAILANYIKPTVFTSGLALIYSQNLWPQLIFI